MAKRKNIIFYFSDQQRWDTVNETVTPNLMQLAKEGTLFENNFTCQPVCGPARACLQTGVYATQCGCYWNGIPLPESITPLAHYFNEAGYDTAYVGKWHLASDRLPGIGTHCEATPVPKEKQGEYRYWRAADVLEFTSHGYDGYIFDGDGNKLDFTGYRADCINDFALEYLESGREADKPFFLFISQLEPHHQNDHHHYEGYKETVNQYKDYPLPPDLTFLKGDYKEMYPDYISAINRLDYNVGRLVQKLKDLGIYDDTVIIYSSDHGSHFKTRNLEYKRSCHDSATHTFEAVLVWKLDRFSRNRYDSAHYKRILKNNRVHVVSVTEPISNTPEGIMLESLLEGMAEYYSAELAEKVSRGHKENALKAKFNGGPVPLGYRIDSEHHYQIDPTTAPVVQEAFQR